MLVSGILPTRARAEYAAQAIEFFLWQNYPEKELIVLDDSDKPSFPCGVNHPLVRYRRSGHLNIPAKRNLCCRLAAGDIVLHFDDDDYSEPERMADQVRRLFECSVTGYSVMPLFDEASRLWFSHSTGMEYCFGTSLAYRRSWWERHPFDEAKRTAEDNVFCEAAIAEGVAQFVRPDRPLMAARIHAGNTSPKDAHGFHRIPEPQSEALRQWAYLTALAH